MIDQGICAQLPSVAKGTQGLHISLADDMQQEVNIWNAVMLPKMMKIQTDADRWTGRQPASQSERQASIWAGKQTESQLDTVAGQKDRQSGRQADRQIDKQTASSTEGQHTDSDADRWISSQPASYRGDM